MVHSVSGCRPTRGVKIKLRGRPVSGCGEAVHQMYTEDWSTGTLFPHGVCMLRECIYGECAHEQHVG